MVRISFLPLTSVARAIFAVTSLLLTATATLTGADAVPERTREQISALLAEKESRTPAQQKLDSQLIYHARQSRGEAITALVPRLELGLQLDATGRVLVD